MPHRIAGLRQFSWTVIATSPRSAATTPPSLRYLPAWYPRPSPFRSLKLKTDATLAALQTRPSVVFDQVVGALSRIGRHWSLTSTANSVCLRNQSSIDCCEAALRSPAPAASTFCTISLGGSFVQPTSNKPSRATDSLIPTSLSSLVPASIPRSAAEGEELLGRGLRRRLPLHLSRLKRLLALKVRQHQLPELHDLLNLL